MIRQIHNITFLTVEYVLITNLQSLPERGSHFTYQVCYDIAKAKNYKKSQILSRME